MNPKPERHAARRSGRGRPTEIDPALAALGAAKAFWRYGYDGASIDALVEATKVSRPGLYRTFGDKEALFLRALDAYEERVTSQALEAFEAQPEISAAVEAFLTISAHNNTAEDMPSGCLIACCAPASAESMPAVGLKITHAFSSLEKRISERFTREVAAGAVSASPKPEDRARMLLDFMAAQAVRARSGESRKELIDAVPSKCVAVLMNDPRTIRGISS